MRSVYQLCITAAVKPIVEVRAPVNEGLAEDAIQAKAWEVLAQRDALWATCTSGKRKITWDLASFMLTGTREVSWALSHAKALNVVPNQIDCVVDFGCGPGRLSGALANHAKAVIGVDPSPTMRKLARSHHPGSMFTFSSELNTVADISVDLVYSTFVLQHLSEFGRRKAMADVVRVLRPGGLFIFQFPHKPLNTFGGLVWKLFPLAALMWIQRRVLRYPEAMPMRWTNPERIQQELRQAGLEFIDHIEGLRYSPNWIDTWYIARKPHND